MCRKIIWLAALCTAVSAASFLARAADSVQPDAAYQMPLAGAALLTDIVSVQERLVVVGERGHILFSDDALNWTQAQVPVQSNLTSVFFINKQRGWAVGHDATILLTEDGGASWQIQHFAPETDKPLFDIYFANAQQGIAVGAYGMFLRTEDGGNSWQPHFHAELLLDEDREYLDELKETDPDSYQSESEALLPHFNRLFADGNVLYMVGEAGFVAKSTDMGANWQRLEEFYNGSLFDLIRTPQMSLLAAGLRGHAFLSNDQGSSWQQIMLTETATLNSAFTGPRGAIYLVGNAGSLLVSRDDGATFTDYSRADGKAIVNGLVWREQLLLVTEAGIKTINLSELE
ncbi:YCF48-related protein [Rheinheimera sp.]|uniref:WD40/YVTN/BNR-like repeat-containing protein n=1 Tax=Rheinheimera sp. TaxID=1869214 RepID=UPI0027337F5C|nr:YCF48-related protein [Rheinheimera sp.]MDP2713261.1 YCF48-related protein [Rheinheimera sp.]